MAPAERPTVPQIACGKCETTHHIDATTGEFQGRCRECFGFLRRPTDAERDQFVEFMAWKHEQTMAAEADE